MNLFGKISILIWLIIFIAAAIMFDWFGSREFTENLLDSSQQAVEKLSETGDHLQDAIEVVREGTEPAREEIKDKIEK
jgi:hypothetical protein